MMEVFTSKIKPESLIQIFKSLDGKKIEWISFLTWVRCLFLNGLQREIVEVCSTLLDNSLIENRTSTFFLSLVVFRIADEEKIEKYSTWINVKFFFFLLFSNIISF